MVHPSITAESAQDPLRRMRVYLLAEGLVPVCFEDAKLVEANAITAPIASQLYAAVCSIEANIAEGYSRSSGKDRARIFEFALGSVRESMSRYRSVTPVLGLPIVTTRLAVLEEMRRMLLAIIPRERGKIMK
jgi:four helix bundle protein